MPSLDQFFIFAIILMLLFFTINTIIWRFFDDEIHNLFDWLILFFTFSIAEILFATAAIGFLGQLNTLALLIVFLLTFVISTRFRLSHFSALARLRHLFFRHPKRKEFVIAIFGWLILFFIVELFNAFIQFPWEYDTIAYHLPIVLTWMKSGNIWDIFYAVWGGPLGYYPANYELLLTFLALPFNNDYLVNLLNFFVGGMVIIVMIRILRTIGVSELLSFISGALIFVMPIFLRQIGTNQVDLLMALFILLSWYYLLRTWQRNNGALLVPFLLSFSIALGTKYLAIPYVIPIAVVFILFWKLWKKTNRYWLIASLIIIGTLGMMWYWRNAIVTGNPFFPASIKFGDTVLIQGYQDLTERIQELSLWKRFLTQDGSVSLWLTTLIKETGWHVYASAAAYLLLVFEILLKLFFGRVQRGEGRLYTVMLFFFPLYWYLYIISPYSASMMIHNVRYAMPWLLLLVILIMFVISKFGAFQRLIALFLIPFAWWQFFSIAFTERLGTQLFLEFSIVRQSPWIFLLMGTAIGFWFFFFETWKRKMKLRFIVFIFAFFVSFSFLQQAASLRSSLRNPLWQKKYDFPLIAAYSWLDQNAKPDAIIANSLNPLYYPLYGKDLNRTVKYININGCGPCDYFSYHQLGKSIRDAPEYEEWKKNLQISNVDFVVLGYSIKEGLQDIYPYELFWTKEHPEDFKKVFEQDGVFVYAFSSKISFKSSGSIAGPRMLLAVVKGAEKRSV